MRSAVVFVGLLFMSGLFVVLQATRKPASHHAVLPRAGTGSAAPGAATKGEAKSKKADAKKKALPLRMNRALRVAALGWELIAPGVVANGGAQPGKASRFSKEGLQVHLSAFQKMEEVDAALARGGADPNGADIAILPLPELVASSEQLRALAPRIFLVVGWSSGHAFFTSKPRALARPPRGGRVELAAPRGSSAAFLGLFLLDLAGVNASRVALLDPAVAFAGGPAARRRTPLFAALPRPTSPSLKLGDELKLLLTTADLRRLVPVVAVAPAGLLKQHSEALAAWGRVWLDGIEQLQRDVPAAARQVASLPQGPPALDLLGRLGEIDSANLHENARSFALSGRDPVTLEELFRRCWTLWRAVGLLSSPVPERAPVHPEIISAMVRIYPTLVEAPAPPLRAASKKSEAAAGGQGEETSLLLAHSPSARRLEQPEALAQVGFVAAVFERLEIKISVRGADAGKAKALLKAAEQRFELPNPRRLHPAAHKTGAPLVLEVSAPR